MMTPSFCDTSLKGKQVLIVDDTPANVGVIYNNLLPEGYQMLIAPSGEKALEIIETSPPDLVLLDVMMPPGIDGFETCSRIRLRDDCRLVPIIFVTAMGDSDSIVNGFKVGGVDYVSKPIEGAELRARVRTHLRIGELVSRLESLSRTDALTGTNNRRYWWERLDAAWAQAIEDQSSVAVVMLDVDNFKDINDRVGHHGGDECLRQITGIIDRCADPEGMVVGRYGGEEFVVLLAGVGLDAAAAVAERIRDDVARKEVSTSVSAQSVCMTVSAGVAAAMPRTGDSPDELMKNVDLALYAAKDAGRNRVVVAKK